MQPLAQVVGSVVGRGFALAAQVRGTKPLHPRGTVMPAELHRTGAPERWGVPWLDEPGTDIGFVRLSRSLGLPEALPDVLGLAFRFEDRDGLHDLLLASAPTLPLLRHGLLPRADALGASYSSSFTYTTPRGPAVLAARPRESRCFALQVATSVGAWQDFGLLRLGVEQGDARVDLDAVRNPLPGLALSPLLAALREPSYASARAHRPDSLTTRRSA